MTNKYSSDTGVPLTPSSFPTLAVFYLWWILSCWLCTFSFIYLHQCIQLFVCVLIVVAFHRPPDSEGEVGEESSPVPKLGTGNVTVLGKAWKALQLPGPFTHLHFMPGFQGSTQDNFKEGSGYEIKACLWFWHIFLTTLNWIWLRNSGDPPLFPTLARSLGFDYDGDPYNGLYTVVLLVVQIPAVSLFDILFMQWVSC